MGEHRRRVIGTLAAIIAVGALVGCGDDDVTAEATSTSAADETPSEEDGSVDEPASEDDADTDATDDDEASSDACPSETLLTSVTETTYEGDVEVLAPDTAFPAAHFTLDLDGSGYGPILDGVLSTDVSEDVASMTHTALDAPPAGVLRVEILLEGPAEGESEYPLGVYDVTFVDGTVDATEGMGLSHLEIVEGDTGANARKFTELELTHIGDDVICGEFRPVDRSDDTSQAPTWLEGAFVADYSERP